MIQNFDFFEEIGHFGIFHQLLSNLQLTCLVTLFDRKLHISQKNRQIEYFGISIELLSN